MFGKPKRKVYPPSILNLSVAGGLPTLVLTKRLIDFSKPIADEEKYRSTWQLGEIQGFQSGPLSGSVFYNDSFVFHYGVNLACIGLFNGYLMTSWGEL